MIAFGKDDSLCEWDEFLRNGWLCWMNRMIRFANGMKTLRFQDG